MSRGKDKERKHQEEVPTTPVGGVLKVGSVTTTARFPGLTRSSLMSEPFGQLPRLLVEAAATPDVVQET